MQSAAQVRYPKIARAAKRRSARVRVEALRIEAEIERRERQKLRNAEAEPGEFVSPFARLMGAGNGKHFRYAIPRAE